jgi:midasin
VYISELDQVFKRHPDFRLFAAQNPHHQGGGRKGLPSSFVNRFVVVYADVFSGEDLRLIASNHSPDVAPETIEKLIRFITELERKIAQDRSFGSLGAPWEFNLRDLLRWLHLLHSSDPLLGTAKVDDLLDIVIRQRFRTERDRQEVTKLFADIFGESPRTHSLYHDINSSFCQVGLALMQRSHLAQPVRLQNVDLKTRLSNIETLILCVTQNIPCILSGPSGSGKSILVQHLAALAGKSLVTFPLNADVDTMDLVGGFEQSDPLREVNSVLQGLQETLQASVLSVVPGKAPTDALQLLHLLATTAEVPEPAILLPLAESLLSLVSPSSEVGAALTRAVETLQKPLTVTNPRFEWLDGVIIKALQTGQWLVLDNANLCSASVLDRLNSLLEPNGFLSINEHCDPDGEPRVVKPHPDFRIFLTTDPRYGELSRAMRNRAIEIHLFEPMTEQTRHLRWVTTIESTLQRYHLSLSMSHDDNEDSVKAITALAFERLTKADVHLLPRFAKDGHSHAYFKCPEVARQSQQLVEFLRADSIRDLCASISNMYSSLPAINSGNIGDAQVSNCTILLFLMFHANIHVANFPRQESSDSPSSFQDRGSTAI